MSHRYALALSIGLTALLLVGVVFGRDRLLSNNTVSDSSTTSLPSQTVDANAPIVTGSHQIAENQYLDNSAAGDPASLPISTSYEDDEDVRPAATKASAASEGGSQQSHERENEDQDHEDHENDD